MLLISVGVLVACAPSRESIEERQVELKGASHDVRRCNRMFPPGRGRARCLREAVYGRHACDQASEGPTADQYPTAARSTTAVRSTMAVRPTEVPRPTVT